MPFIEDLDRRMIADPYGVIVDELAGHLFVGEETTGEGPPFTVGVVGLTQVDRACCCVV